MILYCGKTNVQLAKTNINSKDILFRSESLLIASKKPYKKIRISENRVIFLWGDIYAVKRRNGDYIPLDISTGGETVLRDLFENYEIGEISQRVEGNYTAILLEDEKRAVAFCDAFNRTEVFYTLKSDGVVASTDLAPVVKCLEKVEYSQVALSNMLSVYGYFAPKKLTIYKEVSRLGVGEYLVYDSDAVTIHGTEFIPTSCHEFTEREHHEYADIFNNAVRMRASDHVNWVFLSSGWDSTFILASLIKQYGRSKVRGVIGKMNYSERAGTINQFELDRAHKFAEYFGIGLDVIPLNLCGQDAIDYWKSISPSLKKQHVYSISAYNFFRLTDHILKHGDEKAAIFAGEISDGVHNFGFSQFATILDHPDIGFREYSDKMASYLYGPTFFKSVLDDTYTNDAVYKFLRGRAGTSIFDDSTGLDENGRRMKYFSSFFIRNVRIPFYGLHNTKILTDNGAEMLENELYETYLKSAAEKATPETLYSWLLYLYNSFYWQGGTVRCFGSRLAESGLKLKLPFWDGRLHRFLSEMPEDWGRGLELKPTKYPLKWTLANKLDYPMHFQTGPHAYLYDVNPRFSNVSELLFGSFASSYFKELVKDYPYEKILDERYFDLGYLRKLTDDYRNGVEHSGQERSDLLSLVTLCLIGWY
mgnify:CR=1 FL=1